MKTKGIRISDIKDGKCIPLRELLATVPNEAQFSWALLWLDVTPMQNEGKYIMELQKIANKSESVLFVSFEFLLEISRKIFQEIEVAIIACKVKENIHRYKEDRDMYEASDIVIEMVDGGFWEVFSKNIKWIDQLAKKFQNVEFLDTDFQIRET